MPSTSAFGRYPRKKRNVGKRKSLQNDKSNEMLFQTATCHSDPPSPIIFKSPKWKWRDFPEISPIISLPSPSSPVIFKSTRWKWKDFYNCGLQILQDEKEKLAGELILKEKETRRLCRDVEDARGKATTAIKKYKNATKKYKHEAIMRRATMKSLIEKNREQKEAYNAKMYHKNVENTSILGDLRKALKEVDSVQMAAEEKIAREKEKSQKYWNKIEEVKKTKTITISRMNEKLYSERKKHASILSNVVSLSKKKIANANLKAREANKKYIAQKLDASKALAASEESISQLKDWIECLQSENRDQQDTIIEQKNKINELSYPNHLRRKKCAGAGNRGGAKWPPCMIQIICEMHVNGTPPSAIPANIQMMVHHFYGIELEEVPCINFVRQCRVIVQNIAETLAAYELGNAVSYNQAFFDETTRRQIPFTSFSIGHEDNIVNVSPCIFCEDGTSTMQVEGIIEKVSGYTNYLCA
jgi:hypothetical protein